MSQFACPPEQGLYDPRYEHDACGVGFVVDLKGRKSHDLVQKAIQVLLNLEHRGACGCEKNTGDGAGILLQTPHRFLTQECDKLQIKLPAYREYGVGMVFLPTKADDRQQCEQLFEYMVREEGQAVLGWRTVLTDNSSLGPTAKAVQPVIRQIFIRRENAEDDVVQDGGVQRHAQCRADYALLSGTARPGRRNGVGDGSLAVQHEHVPQLGAGPPIPLPVSQRGNQHAAGQRQLDARPPEHVRVEAVRAGHQETVADHR
jgi:hypothetical protein